MHNGLPHGLLIPLLVMAAIILAILWRDKVSDGGNGGGGGTTTTERDPRITAHHETPEGDEIGESFYVTGRFNSGSADNYDIEAELNGSGVGVTTNGNNYRTGEVNVREENEYEVQISTSVGEDTASGSFSGREETPPEEDQPPRVRVTQQNVDDENREVALRAEAEAGEQNTSIQATGFVKMLHQESGRGFEYDQNPQNSPYINRGDEFLYEDDGLAPGTYHYTAWTVDGNGNADTYTDSFQIEPPEGPGGGRGVGVGVGVGGGAGGEGTPIIYNPQILESRAGDLPEGFLTAIEELAAAIRDNSGSDEVTVELGEELEGLVAAIENLGGEGNIDIEQVVEELRNIRMEIESNSVDLSTLEGQIAELISTVEEQSGLGDEERQFYIRILDKLDDLEGEIGSSPELDDLEDLIEITVEPEQSVEVEGLTDEDRALLRSILVEMRGRGGGGLDSEEFRWFVNQFVSMRANQQNIFQILQVIWMELKEGEDPDGEQDNRDRWEVIEDVVKSSSLDSQIKELLLDILLLRGNPGKKYPFSPRIIVSLRDKISRIRIEEVEDFSYHMVSYFEDKDSSVMNEEMLLKLETYLQTNYLLDGSKFKNQQSASTSMSQDLPTRHIQNLIDNIQTEVKIEKTIIEYDEDALEKLREALNIYQNNQNLIYPLYDMAGVNNQERDLQEVVSEMTELKEKHGIDYTDRETTQEVKELISKAVNLMDEAFQDLRQKDQDIQEIEEEDKDIEEHIEKLEQQQKANLENALDFLETYEKQS